MLLRRCGKHLHRPSLQRTEDTHHRGIDAENRTHSVAYGVYQLLSQGVGGENSVFKFGSGCHGGTSGFLYILHRFSDNRYHNIANPGQLQPLFVAKNEIPVL